jgi:hypothetical protein
VDPVIGRNCDCDHSHLRKTRRGEFGRQSGNWYTVLPLTTTRSTRASKICSGVTLNESRSSTRRSPAQASDALPENRPYPHCKRRDALRCGLRQTLAGQDVAVDAYRLRLSRRRRQCDQDSNARQRGKQIAQVRLRHTPWEFGVTVLSRRKSSVDRDSRASACRTAAPSVGIALPSPGLTLLRL